MKYTTVLALCFAAAGFVASGPTANAMPAAPEKALATTADDAKVTSAHWTGYYHRHWRPYYRPYRPYYRPYYRPRPYYGRGWHGGWHGGWGHRHYRRW